MTTMTSPQNGRIFLLLYFTCIALLHLVAALNGNLPPVFIRDMNLEAIKEDSPIGASVYRLEGKDPEGGSITYGLEGTDNLVVDNVTGIVTITKQLDHETTPTIKFNVTLEKEGNGQNVNHTVSIPVSVVVLRDIYESPAFQEETYDITVPEDTVVGETILENISMIDVGGNLTIVECIPLDLVMTFPSTCDLMSLRTKQVADGNYSVSLILKQQLDYDVSRFHQITLTASNGKQNASTMVTIRIEDVQNKPPVFVSPRFVNITESTPMGTTVMTIRAKDGDAMNARNITYDLLSNPDDYMRINYLTGEVIVSNEIDRESMKSGVITLKVRARENERSVPMDDQFAASTGEFRIAVRDVNDEPPQFNRNETHVTLAEGQPNGAPLPNLNLLVFDPDISVKSALALTLTDSTGHFRLETTRINGSGAVLISTRKGPLDYENSAYRKFLLLITAKKIDTAERFSATATITVNVVDVNDNAPEFASETYVATVSESAQAGTTVTKITAHDKDLDAEYGVESIRYSLIGEGAHNFHVDRITGIISVGNLSSTNLDFETLPSYYLTYQARDANGYGFMSVVSLRVDLLDADDNPPTFLRDYYRGVINEGDVEFSPSFIVEAQDNDKSSILRYEIVSGNANNTFTIDPSTGELRASGSSGIHSDSIGNDKFNLTIKVLDSGQHSAMTNAVISVQDMNNNVPVFDRKEYHDNVSETAPQGFVAGQVTAMDSDTDDNGLVVYRISRGARDCFAINESTGVVTVAADAKLDYDVRPEYNIEIVAVDRGTPPRTAMTTMTITIQNSNNKPPRFTPKIQQAQVSEDAKVGQIIYTLNATDPDANTSEALKYRILNAFDVDNNTFGVDQDSGDVRVVRKIMRERKPEVTMTVAVVDSSANPPQTGTGTLIITVININDAAPIFPAPWSSSSPAIFINVLEEQPVGSIVYTFVAIDADSNIAGYAIMPEDPYFDIDIISGIVTIKSRIDYETIQKHEFKVVAFDTGVPQLSASALVTATINNINDNDPLFNQSEYRATIPENSAVGTSVTTVLARDQDLGDFGRIAYSLLGDHSDVFSIDNHGVIRVKNETILDREIHPAFTVHVVAMDTAPTEMARRSLPTPVIISLLDVNDNVPKFTQSEYRASVMDSILVFPPTPILQLSAKDDDDGLNALVNYKITAGNENSTFILNPRTGVLFPAVPLSGNSKRHALKVAARDGNGTSKNYDETNVIIEVQEVNANAPKMVAPTLKNSTVHITENEFQENKILWTIQAEDPDSGENGRIHYFLKDGDSDLVETSFFSIDPDKGHIKLNSPLDREIKARHTLVVVARDDGVPQPFETLQQLCVVVKDVNDNAPQFIRTTFTNPYAFRVNENLPVGSFVGQVDAFDRDTRDNAAIYYFLQQVGDEGIFAVDRLTGSIYTNRSLDFETQQQYELILKATNNASYVDPRHRRKNEPLHYMENDTTTAHVKVYVGDINDNVPTFPESTYVAGISSNAKIGETVSKMTALDPDREDVSTLMYTIEKTTLFSLGTRNTARNIDTPPFVIGTNGHVTTVGAMSIYSQDHFKMAIKCKESSPPGRSATTTLEAWIYEDEQLITVVLTRTTNDVRSLLPTIIKNLSNVTAGIAIVTDVREHLSTDNAKRNSQWTRLVILVIDQEKRVVKHVPDVLESISRNANYLNVRPEVYNIVEVLPLKSDDNLGEFDIVMATLIAMCIVLLIGIILLVIVINCLKRWYKDKMIAIVTKREMPEPETTTENPLWIDTDSPVWVDPVTKPYEEQELSMAVLNDQEMQNRRKMGHQQNGQSPPQGEAMYATIRRNGRCVRDNLSTMEANDGYAAVNQDHRNNDYALTQTRSPADHNGITHKNTRSGGYHEMNTNDTLQRRPYASPNNNPIASQKPVVTLKPHQGIIHAHEGEHFAVTAVL